MISTWANVVERRELLGELVKTGLKEYSAGTLLGWLWWLLDPLLMMLMYWAVIAGLFGRSDVGGVPYPLFLFPALLTWKHVSVGAGVATSLLRNRDTIIKAIPFPTIILPLSMILSGLINFVIGVALFLVVMLLMAGPYHSGDWLPLLQLPILVGLQLAIVLGICMPLTVVGALVPDLGKVIGHLLPLGFWLSPALYSTEMVRDATLQRLGPGAGDLAFQLYMLNPFARLMTGYRECVLYGRYLQIQDWLVLMGEAALLLAAGMFVYRRLENRVIKFL